MRVFPIITAILVIAGLFMLVFQRETLETAAGVEASSEQSASIGDGDFADAASTSGDNKMSNAVSVVAVHSVAQPIDTPVVLRGRTEANRRVELRAETSGQVISSKLAKGTIVATGDVLCRLDPGTREASLAEAHARLAEATARAPEADARVLEAKARLDEALINVRAAEKLSQGGFASDTRVANAKASAEAARAGFVAAQSGAASSGATIQSAEAAVAAATREIERLKIRAPFPGTLETDSADIGTLLQPGAACATLVQYDPVKIVGSVSELLVDQLQVGLAAGVKLASGRELVGQVTFVADTADSVTRTFRIEVEVMQAEGAPGVRAGQTAEVIITGNGTEAHLLPQSTLTLNDDGELGVRVVNEDNTAGFISVRMIRDSIDGVWVDGLGPAADVIVVGHNYVNDGVRLDVTYQETDL